MRVVLIGCGAISELYYVPCLLALSKQESLTISAIVDPDPRRLSSIGICFPSAFQIKGLDSFDGTAIDLAIIASPQRFHAEQAITMLKQGLHVLCEKPLSSNLGEAEMMVSAAHEANRLLAVGLFRRFWPITQYVKDLLIGEDLGPPLRFHWSEGGVFNWPAATPSFFRKESSPGGVFADLGAHVLDLLLHWFGSVADLDYRDDAMGGLESNALLDLRFANGVSGQVRLSRDTPIPNMATIEFERGTLTLQPGHVDEVALSFKHSAFGVKAALFQKSEAPASAPASWVSSRTYAQSFMEQICNICRAIRGEESLLVPATEALPSMALIDQCYANRRLMAMPWLTAAEQFGAQARTQ
jgi:hypothetical protein